MTLRSVVLLTAAIGAFTILLRFGLKLSSRKLQQRWPVRVHHGYLGILLLLAGILPDLGWALILSDAIHHLVVLPLAVKSTEFP